MRTYRTKAIEAKVVQYLENEESAKEVQQYAAYFGGDLELTYNGANRSLIARVSLPDAKDKMLSHLIEDTQWIVYINKMFYIMDNKDFREHYEFVHEERQSNLVDHAKRELEIIGEDPLVIEGYLSVIKAFSAMGHSGASAMFAIPVLEHLLAFKPLSDLTDDPEDWIHHGEDVFGEKGGIWQNRRNGMAFSKDGGKTYYLISDNSNSKVQTVWYTSKEHKK